jgi:Flp pilus assembly protein TadG
VRRMKDKRNRSAGQAAVEFVLMIVFVMLFFLAMIELVGLIHTYNVLADSAKHAVRYAVVHGTGNATCSGPGGGGVICGDSAANNVKDAALFYARMSFHSITRANFTVDYNPGGANGASACSTRSPACLVRVTAAYQYQPFFGFPWPNVTVRAASEGRIVN